MTNSPDGVATTRLEWMAEIAADPRTTERHYAAAEVLSATHVAPDEHVGAADELAKFGYLIKSTDGTYTGVYNHWKKVQ